MYFTFCGLIFPLFNASYPVHKIILLINDSKIIQSKLQIQLLFPQQRRVLMHRETIRFLMQ